jgi:translation elongation factor EF-G
MMKPIMDATGKDLVQASIAPRSQKDRQRLRLALSAFVENDPSITWPSIHWIEAESGNVLLRAANEADLTSTLDKIKRDHVIGADTGPPQVVCRATIARVTEIDYTHKRYRPRLPIPVRDRRRRGAGSLYSRRRKRHAIGHRARRDRR